MATNKTETLTAAQYHAKFHGAQSESALQQSCVRWFDFQYPELRLNLFAIPNEGKRTPRNGARMKAQGRRAGVADMFLAKAQFDISLNTVPGLFIEFKTTKGKQSPEQIEFQKAITKEGYDYKIIRSLDEFILTIKNYLP